ncbi:MAG: thioredoxin [Prevotellaceae bacterium]|jgi:thioredoxin|nr:thioredoxin [Prevotellaceae bacterium]
MKKILLSIIFTASFATTISAQDNVKIEFLTLETFQQKVQDLQSQTWNYVGDKPCLIDFYASWCGPCRMLSPHLEALAKEFEGKIYIYKIDTQVERQLAQAFNITSIPSLLFCPVGKQPLMLRGYRDKATLEKEINQYLLAQ